MTTNYDILAIGAHPDDIEAAVGGILIDQHKRGRKCAMAILTQGELGTGGTSEIRALEVEEGAAHLGADLIAFLNWGDTKLEDHYDKRLAIASLIRKTRPKIILTPYPHVSTGRYLSHPDHIATGVITLNAANLAALKKIDLNSLPYRVPKIFHYFFPIGITPSVIIDISPHVEQWLTAVTAHRSQFLNPEKARDYLDLITSTARSFGLQVNCKYGQGLYCAEPLCIDDLMLLEEKNFH